MIQSKKRFYSVLFIIVFFISAFLFSRTTYADNSNEEEVYQAVRENVLSHMDTKEEAVYGNEWLALDLIRDGQEVSPYYLKDLVDTIINKNGVLHTGAGDYTNYAKAVLVLTSFGIDASNIAGYNLIEPVSTLPRVRQQGVNGVIYALLALDSHQYDIQLPEAAPFTFTRDDYINAILDSQLPDGGWDWADKQADPDMTAMAVQALAPYYDSYPDVKAAVDTALTTLSNLQQPDGGFQTEDAQYKEASESTSMVILALTALGIDPTKDERFIKNGMSTIDSLCSFYSDGGFKHTADGAYNAMATDQGYRALVSYHRFLEGKTSFYDMTDKTELLVLEGPLTEKVIVTEIDDTSAIEDDIALIDQSSALTDMNGKIECLFDLSLVLADDNNVLCFPISETDTPQTVTVKIPEEKLAELGESVIVIGIHNGELLTIDPDAFSRTNGEVSFKAKLFSTYSIVSGEASEEVVPADGGEGSVTPAKTGDTSNAFVWIMLMAVSILGLIYTAKRRNRE